MYRSWSWPVGVHPGRQPQRIGVYHWLPAGSWSSARIATRSPGGCWPSGFRTGRVGPAGPPAVWPHTSRPSGRPARWSPPGDGSWSQLAAAGTPRMSERNEISHVIDLRDYVFEIRCTYTSLIKVLRLILKLFAIYNTRKMIQNHVCLWAKLKRKIKQIKYYWYVN